MGRSDTITNLLFYGINYDRKKLCRTVRCCLIDGSSALGHEWLEAKTNEGEILNLFYNRYS
jgi:hypothetical protein